MRLNTVSSIDLRHTNHVLHVVHNYNSVSDVGEFIHKT